jgi:peptide/nickel transport system permease protein
MTTSMTSKVTSAILLLAAAALAALGSAVAPQTSAQQVAGYGYAPPMPIRTVDETGRWRRPFVYPLVLVDRLERTYHEDRSRPVRLVWFSEGRLVRPADPGAGPVFLLGADALGRDVLARLGDGARVSLGVALAGALGALLLGALAGGVAGYCGGWTDELLMRLSELVLVLPAIYVILALRTVLPLVLSDGQVFALTATLLALVGWPYVARGVRALVATERTREYVAAARSAGAGHGRILARHVMPACGGFLATQAALLLPAFILAEATLSFVGLGFPEPTPSWGTMLRDARNIRALAEFPWLFSPALAIVCVVLGLNVLAGPAGERNRIILASEAVADRR